MRRFKALRPEPEIVRKYQQVSPALLSAARTSSDCLSTRNEKGERAGNEGLEEKKEAGDVDGEDGGNVEKNSKDETVVDEGGGWGCV